MKISATEVEVETNVGGNMEGVHTFKGSEGHNVGRLVNACTMRGA